MHPRRRVLALSTALLVLATSGAEAWPPRYPRSAPRRPAGRALVRPPYVVPPTAIRVYDGDTFHSGRETVRIRGIDTPEIGQRNSRAAAARLHQLLGAGPVTIVPRVEDVYGRTVADVYVAGVNVADVLRREGFAKPQPPLDGRRWRPDPRRDRSPR